MRNVVVTGASRGIGLAIAQAVAAAGWRAIAVARTQSPDLRAAMDRHPDGIGFCAQDLTEIDGLGACARRLRDRFGAVYGLVNNAGLGTAGILATLPCGSIEALVRLNVTAPITLTKYLIRPMLAARAGRVINIGSIVAATGYGGLAAYGATKAAMTGFTRSLAREVGPVGITVNAIAPGFVETELTASLAAGDLARIRNRSALKRLATGADIAAAAVFLLGDGAANITGTVLTVDAGSTA